MSDYRIKITLTNEDEDKGYIFSDWDEELEDWLLKDDGTPDFGHIYRLMQREYGRCDSSVYVDTQSRGTVRTGWYFVKREQYEDTRETYLRGAWITIVKVVEDARPMVVESVAV